MRFCPSCGTRASDDVAYCPECGQSTQALADQPSVDPLIGQTIDGRYRIETQIGEGGMGIVYLASHRILNKKLALKVLRGEMARDADVVQRFMQEAQAATSIGHQNIIDISDFGRLEDASVYFVMEYLAGEPLTSLVSRGGSLPMHSAIHIIEQMASALGAAHARGIVHRDLKPDNIFLIRRGDDPYFVKVLDFGIAKVGGGASKLTKTGMIFGTPHYMSPEQAAGQHVDLRTDIYALGVIMYEMFTGKVPFDADTFMGILSKHMFEAPVPPSQQQSEYKLGALEDIILKALKKKPEERYQQMSDLLTDLAAVSRGGAVMIGAKPNISPPGGLANMLEPPSRTEMALSAAPPPIRKLPVVALGAAAAVLMLACVGIYLAVGSGKDVAAQPAIRDAGAGQGATAEVPPEPPPPKVEEPPAEPEKMADEMRNPEPEVALVNLITEPPGATVLIGGAIIGNTPLPLPRPTDEDDTRELQVEKRGYEKQTVLLASSSPETIKVKLERQRRRQRRNQETKTTRREPPTKKRTDKGLGSGIIGGDVVDPWKLEGR